MKILVQLPTFARAEKFLRVLDLYVETASSHNDILFNINCDVEDHSMTDEYVKERMKYIFSKKQNVKGNVRYDNDTEKISAINDHISGGLCV